MLSLDLDVFPDPRAGVETLSLLLLVFFTGMVMGSGMLSLQLSLLWLLVALELELAFQRLTSTSNR